MFLGLATSLWACGTELDDADIGKTPVECAEQAWYADLDGDGLGDPEAVRHVCEALSGYVSDATDCDDTDPNVLSATTWWRDADTDGFGNDATPRRSCEHPDGYSGRGGDCDDGDARTYPGAPERCSDGIVNDCTATPGNTCRFRDAYSVEAGSRLDGPSTEVAYFGAYIAPLGDLDGDGRDDLAVSAEGVDAPGGGAGGGRVYIVAGHTFAGNVDAASLGYFDTIRAPGRLGRGIASPGDNSGDGAADLLVRLWIAERGEYDILLLDDLRAFGDVEQASAARIRGMPGLQSDRVGDLDGNGQDDLFLGTGDRSLGLFGFYGAVEGDVDLANADLALVGAYDDAIGLSVTGVGDTNADGRPDVYVGGYATDVDTPVGYLLVDAARGIMAPSEAAVAVVTEAYRGQDPGRHVAAAGDVNGDGFDDVLVGCKGYAAGEWEDDSKGAAAGALLLGPLASHTNLRDAAADFVDLDQGAYGIVAGADLDLDGFSDVVLHQPVQQVAGEWVTASSIFYGPVQGRVDIDEADARFDADVRDEVGAALHAGSDLDGDGTPDIVLGAPSATHTVERQGAVFLILGGQL